MSSVKEYDFSGKKAIVRVDFNVPLDENFNVSDDTRIKAAVPTIKTILENGGSAILMSHLGRPKNGPEDKFSLKHIVSTVSDKLGVEVKFVSDCIGAGAEKAAADLKPGEVLLLENLRFYKEETAGDESFAKKLAALGDIYINDAFGAAHRSHASTAIIAKFFPKKKYFGLLLAKEIAFLEQAIINTNRPFTAIIGGAKITGKIDVRSEAIAWP